MQSHIVNNNTLVSLSRVSFAYDRNLILQDVNLVVDNHDFVVITGTNGGGKTTLLRLLLRLLTPTSGAVEYYQRCESVTHLSIGYLPQKNSIDNHFPIVVEEVIRSGLYATKSLDRNERRLRVQMVMEQLHLTALAQRPIGELSGGQLQRVLLGRAVVSRPQLLVLDEPFSYIDDTFVTHICEMLQQIKSHTAVVMVTHQPALVLPMATQTYVIEEGRLR